MASATRLIGFVGKEAARLPCLLRRFTAAPWLAAADGIQPWGVGQYTGEQTIRRTQPGRLNVDLAIGDLLLADARSPMLIARAAAPGSPPREDEQPFRFGRWFLALQGEIAIAAQRAAWLAALPPFLLRARRSRGDPELLFLHIMARLHEEHLLDAPLDDQPAAARVLGEVAAEVAPPINLLATNGLALFACRAAGPLSYCTFAGIPTCAPCRVGDGFTRFPPTVEAHHAFRAVCVASAPFDAGEPWQEIPAGAVLVVGLLAHTQIVALGSPPQAS